MSALLLLLLLILVVVVDARSSSRVVAVGGVSAERAEFRITGRANDIFRVFANVTNQNTGDVSRDVLLEVKFGDSDAVIADTVKNLQANTLYGYEFQDTSEAKGTFRTFPTEGKPANVTMAFGACLFNIDSGVFRDIASHDPDFFMFSGDMFYGNVAENDVEEFNEWYEELFQNPALQQLLSTTPISAMWDDHDYGPNDSDQRSPSRNASRKAYRRNIPHYKLPSLSRHGIFQAFSIGRVRVIMTDCRSEANPVKGRLWSNYQLYWFRQQLHRWKEFSAILWLTTVPFIGKDKSRADDWSQYPAFRANISEYTAERNIDNIIILSGDAHMIAMDDGTNSDYSKSGGAGIPVFHAGPLSNSGSAKGGPYSEGCHSFLLYNNEQYGVIDITDFGKSRGACVRLRGYNELEVVMEMEMCTPFVKVEGTRGGSGPVCEINWFPSWVWVAFMSAVALTMAVVWIICKEDLPGFTCTRKKRLVYLSVYIAVLLFNLAVPFLYSNIQMHVWVGIILFLSENIMIVLLWMLGKRTLRRQNDGRARFDLYGEPQANHARRNEDTVRLAEIDVSNFHPPQAPRDEEADPQEDSCVFIHNEENHDLVLNKSK